MNYQLLLTERAISTVESITADSDDDARALAQMRSTLTATFSRVEVRRGDEVLGVYFRDSAMWSAETA